MSIVTRSCHAPSDAERYDDWRASGGNQLPQVARRALWRHEKPRVRIIDGRLIGTYRSKRGPVPDCPQSDEFDERTPLPTNSAEPVHEAGKDSV